MFACRCGCRTHMLILSCWCVCRTHMLMITCRCVCRTHKMIACRCVCRTHMLMIACRCSNADVDVELTCWWYHVDVSVELTCRIVFRTHMPMFACLCSHADVRMLIDVRMLMCLSNYMLFACLCVCQTTCGSHAGVSFELTKSCSHYVFADSVHVHDASPCEIAHASPCERAYASPC